MTIKMGATTAAAANKASRLGMTVMKSSGWKIALAVLAAALVGTSRTSWATTFDPPQSFDLGYNMSAAPFNNPAGLVYTDWHVFLSFPDGQTFTTPGNIDLQVYDSGSKLIGQFLNQPLPLNINLIGLGINSHLSSSTTDPIGMITVTLDAGAHFENLNLNGSSAFLSVAPATTPLPAALPLFATGLGAMGLLGWRRKRKNAAAIAAA
jgi:hypothetical protein